MISCVVNRVLNNNTYVLNDKYQNYEIVFEFYGLDNLSVGDKLLINSKLLDKNSRFYTQPYAFEVQKDYDAELVKELNDIEYIVVKKANKNYVLKRIYG